MHEDLGLCSATALSVLCFYPHLLPVKTLSKACFLLLKRDPLMDDATVAWSPQHESLLEHAEYSQPGMTMLAKTQTLCIPHPLKKGCLLVKEENHSAAWSETLQGA